MNKRIYNPLEGSKAKVCTLVNTPDLTRKVPTTLKRKASIANKSTQACRDFLFSTIIRECNKAVPINHGIKDAFSTGSQNHHPPHPNS